MNRRTPSRVFAAVFAATLVLAGCGPALGTTSTSRLQMISGDGGGVPVLLGAGGR